MTSTYLHQTNFTDYLTDILYELAIAAWRTCIASFADTTTPYLLNILTKTEQQTTLAHATAAKLTNAQ